MQTIRLTTTHESAPPLNREGLEQLLGARAKGPVVWGSCEGQPYLKPWDAALLALLMQQASAADRRPVDSRRDVGLVLCLAKVFVMSEEAREFRPVVRFHDLASESEENLADPRSHLGARLQRWKWSYISGGGIAPRGVRESDFGALLRDSLETSNQGNDVARNDYLLEGAKLGLLPRRCQLEGNALVLCHCVAGAFRGEQLDLIVKFAPLIRQTDFTQFPVTDAASFVHILIHHLSCASPKAINLAFTLLDIPHLLNFANPLELLPNVVNSLVVFSAVWGYAASKGMPMKLEYGRRRYVLQSVAHATPPEALLDIVLRGGFVDVLEFVLDRGDISTLNIREVLSVCLSNSVRHSSAEETNGKALAIVWRRLRYQIPETEYSGFWLEMLAAATESDFLLGIDSLRSKHFLLLRLNFLFRHCGNEIDVKSLLQLVVELTYWDSAPLALLRLFHSHGASLPHNFSDVGWGFEHNQPDFEAFSFLVEDVGIPLETSGERGTALLKKAFETHQPYRVIAYLLERGCTLSTVDDRAFIIAMIDRKLTPLSVTHALAKWFGPAFDSVTMKQASLQYDEDRLLQLKLLLSFGVVDANERMFGGGQGIAHRLRFNVFWKEEKGNTQELWWERTSTSPPQLRLFEFLVEELKVDFSAVDDEGESPLSIAVTRNDFYYLQLLCCYKPLPDGTSRFLPNNLLSWRNTPQQLSPWFLQGSPLLVSIIGIIVRYKGSEAEGLRNMRRFCTAIGHANAYEMTGVQWGSASGIGKNSTSSTVDFLQYLLASRVSTEFVRYFLDEIGIKDCDRPVPLRSCST